MHRPRQRALKIGVSCSSLFHHLDVRSLDLALENNLLHNCLLILRVEDRRQICLGGTGNLSLKPLTGHCLEDVECYERQRTEHTNMIRDR